MFFIPYTHQGFWDWEVFQLLSCHILERYKSHTCCYFFPIKDPACLAKIPMVRQLHIINLYDLYRLVVWNIHVPSPLGILAQGGAFTPAFPPGRMVPARALPGAAEEEPAPL